MNRLLPAHQSAAEREAALRRLLGAGTVMFVVLAHTSAASPLGIGITVGVLAGTVAIALAMGNTWYGLIVTIVVTCCLPIPRFSIGTTDLTAGRLLSFLVIVGWFAQRRWSGQDHKLRRTPLDGALLLLFVGLCASFIANFTKFQPFELDGAVRKTFLFGVDYLMLFWIASAVLNSRQRVLALTRVVGFTIALTGLFGVIEHFTGRNVLTFLNPFLPKQVASYLSQVDGINQIQRGYLIRIHSTIGGPVSLGCFLVMGVPICLGLRLAAESARGAFFWLVSALLIGSAILFTASRSAYLITGIAVFLFMLLVPEGRGRFGILAFAVLIVIALVSQADVRNTAHTFAHDNSGGLQLASRTADYGPVLSLVNKRPIFGYGPRTFAPDEIDQNELLTDTKNRVLDNAYLDQLGEGGILGIVGLFSVLLTGSIVAFRAFRRAPDYQLKVISLGLFVAIVSWSLAGWIADEYIFGAPPRMFFVVLALACAARRLSGWTGHDPTSQSAWRNPDVESTLVATPV